MTKSVKSFTKSAAGRVRLFQVRPEQHTELFGAKISGIWFPVGNWHGNDEIVDSAVIMQKLLRNAEGGKWFIGGMYIEFDNSGSPVDPVPTINVEEGLEYYNALNSGDPNRDYLRVGLIASAESVSDESKYPLGNVCSFITQTVGSTGVHGNAFSAAANSAVYGGALVSFVNSEAENDLVWSRFYLPPASQVNKVVSSQVGLTWQVSFTE